jgi:hypothetical protein
MGYIDADIIMSQFVNASVEELLANTPSNAITPLSCLEGYATTPDGLPFWERLDGEQIQYYELFKAYRDMIYTKLPVSGDREKILEGPDITNPRSITSLRSLYIVAQRADIGRPVIKTISQMYHWAYRVKAYDLFRRAHIERTREFEVERMQNTHATAARKIFDRCLTFIEDHVDELNPKTALEWLQTAVELERLSLGLNPNKPDTDSGDRPWVQINQQSISADQVNQQEISIGGAPGNNIKREQRITEILNILKEARALDVDAPIPKSTRGNGATSHIDARFGTNVAEDIEVGDIEVDGIIIEEDGSDIDEP